MSSKEKYQLLFFSGIVGLFTCLPLFICANKPFAIAPDLNQPVKKDTILPSEVYSLRRPDIYVVVVNDSDVKILLKKNDSIIMPRKMFDTMSAGVKKEISAHNDGVFTNSFTEPIYPGGVSRWMAYINKNLKYPVAAENNGIHGTVVLRFFVNVDGSVSQVEAVSGPSSGGLREEAVRIIQKSGKWTPAIWNGYQVSSYKQMPLTFTPAQ